MKPVVLLLPAVLMLAACGGEGLSTAEAQSAAEQRVREKFGLGPQAALETDVFVGREREGEPVVCGRVNATRPDGAPIPTQFFIAALDPARWLMFNDLDTSGRVAHPNMFPDWTALCAGASGETP